MAKYDLKNDIQIAAPLSATLSGTTPQSTPLVDMQGFESCTFLVSTGTITDAGTASGIAVEVQESDGTVLAAFTAVGDTDLVGTEAALNITLDTADNVPVGSIGYVGTKRYVRLVLTGTTGTNGVVNVIAVKGNPEVAPVTAIQNNIAGS